VCPAHNQRGNPEADGSKGWGDRLRKDRDLVPGFGQRLRMLREAAGLSQPALAAASGTHYTNVARLEAEARSPSFRLALALAGALGVSVADLVPDHPPAPNRRTLLAAIEGGAGGSHPAPKKGRRA
jgi:ribosome-binding protein aMBF1 (putative translation factor)